MIYKTRQLMEEHLYDRMSRLVNAQPFKGVSLKRNNPLNMKRFDSIPVADAVFEDGTSMSVTLRSDNSHYFFHADVKSPDGRPRRHPSPTSYDDPFDLDKTRNVRFAEFVAYDPDTNSTYELVVECIPDHTATITINAATDTLQLYYGTVHEMPQLTDCFFATAIADTVMREFNQDMSRMASFLLGAKYIAKEERITKFDDTWLNRTVYDTKTITPYLEAAAAIIESRTGWDNVHDSLCEGES